MRLYYVLIGYAPLLLTLELACRQHSWRLHSWRQHSWRLHSWRQYSWRLHSWRLHSWRQYSWRQYLYTVQAMVYGVQTSAIRLMVYALDHEC
jgi:hypothetical protein